MKKLKKAAAVAMAAVMAVSLAACTGGSSSTSTSGSKTQTQSTASTAEAETSGKTYTVGICQLVQHPALDAATKGFKKVLKDEFGDSITFDEQNAAGDSATAATICNSFASNNVDLILANATPALQAAAAATSTIPVLGTAVTDYGVALDIKDFDGTVGTNVSGTSDLPPLDQQADMITEIFPEAKTVGILYCSAEPNSVYQADQVKAQLEKNGISVKIETFADSNDVASVTSTICDESDVVYIPTDNTAASCTEAINNVAINKKVPIVAGEEGIMAGCGVATLSIDYEKLGETTGEMAVKILKGEADVSQMPIEYYDNPVKEYNPTICEKLGVTVPDGYTAYKADEE